jgi:copper chaperone CopZ
MVINSRLVLATAMAGLCLGTVGVMAHANPSLRERVALHAGQATTTIEIPEVGCSGCSFTIRKAVKSAGGVLSIADGDPANRLVIAYDPAVGRPEAYVEALHKAGYPKAKVVNGS